MHVLGYLKSNPQHGIQFTRNDNANIANRLFLYVDATWADDEFDRKSTSGMCLHFNGGPVIWKSKKQPIIAQSSCESEIIAATYGANEAVFVKQLASSQMTSQAVLTVEFLLAGSNAAS